MSKRGISHTVFALVLSIIALMLLLAVVAKPDSGQAIGAAGDWEEVGIGSASGGGISNNSGESGWPAVATNESGEIFVAWYDKSSGDSEIYVHKWSGSQWVEVGSGSASGGGISNNSGESKAVSLAVKADGNPCAAWRDWSSGYAEIYVRCWNGSQWSEVGPGSALGGGVSNQGDSSTSRSWPSLVVASDGSMYLAWENSDGSNTEIYVAMWDRSSWKRLGGSGGNVSNNSGDSWVPALGLSADDKPYVGWHDESTGSGEIYVRRWNGSSWIEVGSGSTSGGGISNSPGHSMRAAIDLDKNGFPYISWADNSAGNYEIFVRRWNGSSWIEVGNGSANSGGISNNAGSSEHAQTALNGSGLPCITWQDSTQGANEVYVRCWNGTAWAELGSGSAAGGGISKNVGESSLPALAFGSDGNPYAAWGDNSSGNYEIYVRRYDSPPEQTPTATPKPATNTPSAWNFLPIINGANPGPTLTPSLTPTPTNTPDPGRLAAPTLYDIINNDGEGNFAVGWSTAPDAEYYRLEEQKDGVSWQQIYEGPALSFTRSSLSDGQYCYRVRALNSVTDSEWSAYKCVDVGVEDTPTPTQTATPEEPTYECTFETLYDGPRTNGSITMMQNGDVFIFGGEDVNGATTKSYIFNPQTKNFRYIGDPHYHGHRGVTTLNDGRILLPFPGAYLDDNNNWQDGNVEIFDPLDEKFYEQQTTAFCNHFHKIPRAIALPNGEVLIACPGGNNGSWVIFQKYDVSSDSISDWHFEAAGICFTRFCFSAEPMVVLIHAGKYSNWVISNVLSAYDIYYNIPEEIPINNLSDTLGYQNGTKIALSWNQEKLYSNGGVYEYFEYGKSYSREASVLDTSAYTLSKLPSLTIPRSGHNLLPLTDGNMVILGGTTPIEAIYGENPNFTEPTFDTKIIGTVELYDAQRQRFYDAGSLNIERTGAEALTLLNGEIFVYGGTTNPGPGYSTIAPAEIGRCERVN